MSEKMEGNSVKKVSGGYPGNHRYTYGDYDEAGIRLEHYTLKKDKFYDRKSKSYIEEKEANRIVDSIKLKPEIIMMVNYVNKTKK